MHVLLVTCSCNYIFSRSGDQEVCREADGNQGREDRHTAEQGHLVPGREGRPLQDAGPPRQAQERGRGQHPQALHPRHPRPDRQGRLQGAPDRECGNLR